MPLVAVGETAYKNYVGGEWVDATSGETFVSIDPATGETVGVFPASTAQDMDRAVSAALDAYERWSRVVEVHLPFCGMKDTGNGHREAGQAALDFYTEWKALYLDYSGRLQRAQIDNQ
jgi:aldehyde dehydrogenase (NAD+)